MNRLFVTGDTHGDYDIGKITYFKNSLKDLDIKLDREDYLIICGDAGIFWDDGRFDAFIKQYWEAQPFTVLWIDGNHENFDKLNSIPIEEKWGGKVQKCAENVYHLMRGEVYDICNCKFFTFGGATSHDKEYRKAGVTWWRQEMPTLEEMCHGLHNLEKCDYKVDYILTHCADSYSQSQINPLFKTDELTHYLYQIYLSADWKKWYVGHYHMDRNLMNGVRVLYQDVIELD